MTELTTEQKKEKARLAQQEAAAKNAAQTENANDQTKADQKAADEARKLQEATAAVTTDFNNLKGYVDNGNTLIANLTAESTVEQIEEAGKQAGETLKSAKASLTSIKKSVKKLKEPGDLKVALEQAETMVETLDSAVKSVKGKVSEAKKAKKDAEKAEAKRLKDEQKAANAMPNQNGITRPRPDTACGNAWALMDELSEKLKQPVPIALLLQAAEKRELNHDTVKTQYARWKKFNGIEGRVQMPLPTGLLD
jgi:chromosome segregation ATPase